MSVEAANAQSLDLRRRAQEALSRRDGVEARSLLEDLLHGGDGDVAVWLAHAQACVLCGDMEAEKASIDRVLQVAPNDPRALVARADHLVRAGDLRGASVFYSSALRRASPEAMASPAMQDALRRAQSVNDRLVRELEDHVRARLETLGVSAATTPTRFSDAIDILFQRKRPYVQEPKFLFYPELANVQFFPREMFPWLGQLEDATDLVREELIAQIGPGFRPYIERETDRPQRDFQGLADNADWSALFLIKDGAVQPAAAQCPAAMAALEAAPLCKIPGRTPSVLFSKLAAGAHIPAHTGMLNTRLICHLPLIVPEGCAFRVGNETRSWREGAAWVFDDTIEHEAWNRSAHDRYILIFDVWRPELSAEERVCIAALVEAIDQYQGGAAWNGA